MPPPVNIKLHSTPTERALFDLQHKLANAGKQRQNPSQRPPWLNSDREERAFAEAVDVVRLFAAEVASDITQTNPGIDDPGVTALQCLPAIPPPPTSRLKQAKTAMPCTLVWIKQPGTILGDTEQQTGEKRKATHSPERRGQGDDSEWEGIQETPQMYRLLDSLVCTIAPQPG